MNTYFKILFPVLALSLAGCNNANSQESKSDLTVKGPAQSTSLDTSTRAEAIFAGGCFWCVEADFEKLPGVIDAISGYAGGHVKNPSYQQVSHGGTGHYEVAKIIYNPTQVSYEELLEYFWTHVDPTDDGGQFCDRGHSYKTAIFANADQFAVAQKSKQMLQASGRLKNPVVTPVIKAPAFYEAERYHQDYYKKNPVRYKYYRTGCRRDSRIKKVWGTH